MERYQKKIILSDLKKKMVLLAGPRQAGKTTLAKMIAKEFGSSTYLTYDRSEDRKIILKESWIPSVELIILDEIHKMPNWKNYLKGIYDTKLPHQKILVTGSARLEIFNQVGDSLAGRYFMHRLMPLSPRECDLVHADYTLDRFLERGSFPEPFLAEDLIDAECWRLQYIDSLLVDVFDFENIHNLKAIRLIFELLRERVGSPISYLSLSEDVSVSPNTVKKYIQILEALYIIFRIVPFSNNIARSLLKEPKIYFFDTGLVRGDNGVRFENFVAVSLIKHVFANVDYMAKNYSLHYLHTKERREVDFALVADKKIEKIIEVKYANSSINPALLYFHKKYNLPACQVVKELKNEKMEKGIEIMEGVNFLKNLYL